jgi:hypothetical protein
MRAETVQRAKPEKANAQEREKYRKHFRTTAEKYRS